MEYADSIPVHTAYTDSIAAEAFHREPAPMEHVHPVDSAFHNGRLELGTSATQAGKAAPAQDSNVLADSLSVASAVVLLMFIRKLVNIIPSLISCLLRWKEAFNLEYSVKLSRDRDIIYYILIIPFCLTVDRYRLYSPDFMDSMNDTSRLLVTTGAILAYMIARAILFYAIKGKKTGSETYFAAGKSFCTFFCLTTLSLSIAAGALSLFPVSDSVTRDVLLYIIGIFYLLSILRKCQIFSRSCKVLTTILYLCSLEFLPTGLFVATALIF